MKKRILALSLAAAMVVGALASCTAKTEPAGSSAVEARDIKLTLWGSEGDQAFLKEVSAAWAEQYTKDNADVASATVDVQIKGEDVAGQDALNDIEAAADVFGVANDQLAGLTAANAIYQMPDSVISDIKAVVGDGYLNTTMCDGNYYGFPYLPNVAEVLFYNTELYTEEEVASLNTMLEKDLGGVTNLVADVNSSWNSMTWFATAGAELFTKGDKTVDTMNKPEATAVLSWLQEQVNAKKIVDTDSPDDAAALLKDGKAAALFYGDWASDSFKDALGDNFGVRALPNLTVEGAVNDQHMKCFGGSKLLVLNATTKEPDAALSLAQYIISDENQLKRFQMTSASPTATSLVSNAEVQANALVGAVAEQGANTVNNEPLNGTADYWTLEQAIVTDLYAGKLTGSDNIQAALDTLVENMQANVGA